MSKRASTLEWQVAKDDTDWTRLGAPPMPAIAPNAVPAIQSRLVSKQFLWEMAAIFLLLASAGSWWWRTHPGRLQQAEAEGTAQPTVSGVTQRPDRFVTSAPDHQSDPGWWLRHGQEVQELRTAVQTAEPASPLDIALYTVDVQGEQAVTRVVTTARSGAYRQTLFYQRTANGWQQTPPDAALWGPERSLETPSFVFHFRQNDAAAVIAVAPQVEALYRTVWQNFGLSVTAGAEKLVINVSVTQLTGDTLSSFRLPGPLTVPSPAVYLAPVELTDAELLAQSMALPLLDDVIAQASAHYEHAWAWQSLLSGLYLWQVWDLDLPLATWREEVVKWIYIGLPATNPGEAIPLPEHYTALCAAHKLWMPSPRQLHIPLLCNELGHKAEYYPIRYARNPPTRLDQLAVPVSADEYLEAVKMDQVLYPGQIVALATLVEYAAVTYGHERLPTLVAGLGHYESWETLLPAVYGVSPAEFEAGWQAYLAAHYGVPER